MFNKARMKLTTWYLLIIMTVSVSFSIVIFRISSSELDRFSRLQRVKIERQFQIDTPFFDLSEPFAPELIEEAQRRLLEFLVIVNGIILVSSGGLGYFLAGRTLEPISDMLDEQNQFITDASHELKTPLTSLKTAFEVNLRDKNMKLGDAKKLIKESVEEVDKLQKLSEGLLMLAHFEGQNHLSFEKVSLKDIVGESKKRIKSLSTDKNINIKDETKDYVLRGDQEKLTDLLVILLDNAIKYSKKNTEITIQAKRTDRHILISVTDQGVGINKKELPFIFDRFYRSDKARVKTHADGYGLGLSIAKKIVEAHKGTIKVKSKVGKGSKFVIKIPRANLNYSFRNSRRR